MSKYYCRHPDCTDAISSRTGRNVHESTIHPEYDFRVVRLIDNRVVVESGCWEWQGTVNNEHGYGHIEVNNEAHRAHRLSYEVFCGELDADLQINHKCDNKICINPDHLYQGTHQENMNDAAESDSFTNSTKRGEEMYNSKLTSRNVKEIRERYSNSNTTQKELADEFGVSQSTITKVVNGEMWSHV